MTPETCCFPVAELNISDVSVTVVFARFDGDTDTGPEILYGALQKSIRAVDSATDIVLLWQDSEGRTSFIAPLQQHRFFEIMKYDQLYAQVNGAVTLKRD